MTIRYRVSLAPFTTLGIGGQAAVLGELADCAEFPGVVDLARQHGTTPLFLGGGSNVLVDDKGCTVPVVLMRTRGLRMRRATAPDVVEVTAEAGHPLQDLVDTTIDNQLSGLELMTGIPGSVGAAPVQNVGAYGQEIADSLVEVCAWDWLHSQRVRLRRRDCGFGHRTSIFKRSRRWTVLTVTFALRRSTVSPPIRYPQVANVLGIPLGKRLPLDEAAAGVLTVRRRKGMVLERGNRDNRSVGSVFVSSIVDAETAARLRAQCAPVYDFADGTTRISASWLMRVAGFALGQRVTNGVRISYQHHTLIATDGANASDFAAAMTAVMHQVYESTGVLPQPEVDTITDAENCWPFSQYEPNPPYHIDMV